MAFAILGILADGNLSINNFESVAVSNPDFLRQIKAVAIA